MKVSGQTRARAENSFECIIGDKSEWELAVKR